MMYSNNILNFQESTTILNAYAKKLWKLIEGTTFVFAQIVGAVEYADCMSVTFKTPPNDCLGYDTKQSDGENLVMLGLWEM